MNMIRRSLVMVVLASAFGGMGLFAASSASGFSGPGGSGSSSSSSSVRSMMGHVPGDGASDPGSAAGRPGECIMPEKGMLFYVLEGSESIIPWVCANRELLVMAIRRSARGPVLGQAPNVFYVNRESFENLKNHAEGRPANLYYVVSPGLLFDLYSCPNKELLRQAIVENGCKHARNQSANVFIVNQEWAGVLKSAGGALVTDFKYVVEGDEITNVRDSSLNRDAVKNAINKLECRHVTGNSITNIYYITRESHDKIFYGNIKKKIASKAGMKLYVAPVGYAVTVDTYHEAESRTYSSEAPDVYQAAYTSRAWNKVWLCSNQELVRAAIVDSNKGMASKELEDVFYVTSEWMQRLKAAGARCVDHPHAASCSIQ